MINRILAVVCLLGTMGMLTVTAGCNTVEGLGKDIERGGEKTQDTARDVKRKM